MHLNGISMGASHAGPVESFERRSPTSTKRNNLNHGAQRRFRVTGNSGFFFFFWGFFLQQQRRRRSRRRPGSCQLKLHFAIAGGGGDLSCSRSKLVDDGTLHDILAFLHRGGRISVLFLTSAQAPKEWSSSFSLSGDWLCCFFHDPQTRGWRAPI